MRSQLRCLNSACDSGECAYENYNNVGILAAQPLEQFNTRNAWHPHIGDDQVGLMAPEVLQSFRCVLSFADFVRKVVKRLTDEHPIGSVVVNDKN